MSGHHIDHTEASRPVWYAAVIFGFITLVCGWHGGCLYERQYPPTAVNEHETKPERPDSASVFLSSGYHALQMLILHSPHYEHPINGYLEMARWSGAVTAFLTAWVLFNTRLRRELLFIWMKLRWREHVVICGMGSRGYSLACSIKAKKCGPVVLIDSSPDPHVELKSERKGFCVVRGDATEEKILRRTKVRRARLIVAVTDHDETNIRIAREVRHVRLRETAKAKCRVHLASVPLRESIDNWAKQMGSGSTDIRFFDVFERESARVLKDLIPYKPMPEVTRKSSGIKTARIVIFGCGRMGSSVAHQAATLPRQHPDLPLRIDVIDRDAARQREQFLFRYPELGGHVHMARADDDAAPLAPVADEIKPGNPPEVFFHRGNADAESARVLLERWRDQPGALLHVFLTIDSNTRAAEVGLRFATMLETNPNHSINIRVNSTHSMGAILEVNNRVKTFGKVEDSCTIEALEDDMTPTPPPAPLPLNAPAAAAKAPAVAAKTP